MKSPKNEWLNRVLLKQTWSIAVISILISLITMALELTGPLVANLKLDQSSEIGTVIWAIILVAICFLCSGMIRFIYNIIKNKKSIKSKTKMLEIMLGKMTEMEYGCLIQQEPTYLFERIAGAVNVFFRYYAETIPEFISAVLTVSLCLLTMFFVNIYVVPVFLLVFLIQVFGYKKLNQKLSALCVTLSQKAASKWSIALSILANSDYIKQLPNVDNIIRLISEREKEEKEAEAYVNTFGGNVGIVFDVLTSLLNYSIYILSPVFLFAGIISIGESIYLSTINSLFFAGVKKLTSCHLNLSEVRAMRKFVDEDLLAHSEDLSCGEDYGHIHQLDFDIEKMKVGEQLLIQDGKARLLNGDLAKVEGRTGTGKSVLLKSLVGYWDTHYIQFNGQMIQAWNKPSLRRRVMYVPQNTSVFVGTIADNILFGKQMSTDNLKARLADSGMGEYFTGNLDYDTQVLENGANLSGGDKQKIALARIFLEDWDVLILDESTSALDIKTESEIMELIQKKIKQENKIGLIISHSPSVNTYCNQRILIQDKKLVMGNEGKSFS